MSGGDKPHPDKSRLPMGKRFTALSEGEGNLCSLSIKYYEAINLLKNRILASLLL